MFERSIKIQEIRINWSFLTLRQNECACSADFALLEERLVIPAWMNFAEERTELRFTLFGTDIDVIRPEKFLVEFVLMEKSDGLVELL